MSQGCFGLDHLNDFSTHFFLCALLSLRGHITTIILWLGRARHQAGFYQTCKAGTAPTKPHSLRDGCLSKSEQDIPYAMFLFFYNYFAKKMACWTAILQTSLLHLCWKETKKAQTGCFGGSCSPIKLFFFNFFLWEKVQSIVRTTGGGVRGNKWSRFTQHPGADEARNWLVSGTWMWSPGVPTACGLALH